MREIILFELSFPYTCPPLPMRPDILHVLIGGILPYTCPPLPMKPDILVEAILKPTDRSNTKTNDVPIYHSWALCPHKGTSNILHLKYYISLS